MALSKDSLTDGLIIAAGGGLGWWWYNAKTYKNMSVKEAQSVGIPSSEEGLIAGLDPRLQPVARKFVEAANAAGYRIRLTQGRRTIAEQNSLYAKGRTTAGPKVTNAPGGSSPHNFGMAIDFAFLTPDGRLTSDKNGEYSWGNGRPWAEVAKFGKSLGLEWGGDWRKFKDRPHLEMPGWKELMAQWKSGKLKVA